MSKVFSSVGHIFENKTSSLEFTSSETQDFIVELESMGEDKATQLISELDSAYEKGAPLVSDDIYDNIVLLSFTTLYPDSDILSKVREQSEEELGNLDKVVHSRPMLSTDKAYDKDEIDTWVNRVVACAKDIGINENELSFSVTPKLDGLAGRHENGVLATRGNGEQGFNVSHVYDIGVISKGGIADGDGELVLSCKYFDDNLADEFSHPRNVMVGIVKADTLTEASKKTLADKAAYFIRYNEMEKLYFSAEGILDSEDFYQLCYENLIEIPDFEFPIDGFVVVVNNERIQEEMGHNSHHHKWMLAIKKRGEAKDALVKDVILQTGRTGRITPVIEIEPTSLSGAIVRRVTGHNLKLLAENGIGKGAIIKVIRSGEVIPYVSGVVEPSEHAIELKCPSCNSEVVQVSDSIYECVNNTHCPAQLGNSIIHHFKTLDVKNYGQGAVSKILESGKVSQLSDVYKLTHQDFMNMGFGNRQAEVLVEERAKVINTPQKPEKLTASFGIKGLGVRASKALLEHFEFDVLSSGLVSADRIAYLDNFGKVSAKQIATGINDAKEVIANVMSYGVTLEEPEIIVSDSFISGKNIIFTGTMSKGNRKDMEAHATSLGAKVQKSVSKTTDYLIAGEKAGSKMDKAQKLGVKVLTEDEYLELIG